MAETERRTLDVSADQALFTGQVEGLIVSFHENERPLKGLAGLLDWRLHGAISEHLRSGAITGQAGECVYFPVTRNQNTYHLILVGAGPSSAPGVRKPLSAQVLKTLKRNLDTLGLKKLGISWSDLGNPGNDYLKELPVWIVQ